MVDMFKVEITFRQEDRVQQIREGDRSISSEFFRLGYRGKELTALNMVQCYRNLLHISDIVKCDGATLDEFVVSDGVEESLSYTFPHEEPISSDFRRWEEAMKRLCNGTAKIPYQLGKYLRPPH